MHRLGWKKGSNVLERAVQSKGEQAVDNVKATTDDQLRRP